MDGGRPTILYTSVGLADCDVGRIFLALGDASFDSWAEQPAAVVDGPPPEFGVVHFRDPFVWRADDGWHMVVGAGLASGAAAVLGYASSDLRNWEFRGVTCSRPGEITEPVRTGSVWECPQLFELDGTWMLIVSAAHEGLTRHVAYAVGDYDGCRFRPLRWHRLLYGDSAYATTTFLDATGRRCALSWLREDGPVEDRQWAGALSLPLVLRRDGDRVLAVPHPVVDALRTGVSVEASGSTPLRLGPIGAHSDVVLEGRQGDGLDVAVQQDDSPVLTLALAGDTVMLRRPGRPDEPIPLGAAADGWFQVRLLIDASVAEVFTPRASAAARIRPVAAGELSLTAVRGHGHVDRAVVHQLA